MTRRAIVLGLLGAAVVGGVGYFNDMFMHQTFLFSTYMPMFIFGFVMLFVVLLNPVLFHASRRIALTGRELAVIVALVLPACAVSSRNLIHHFTSNIIVPRYYNLTEPGWRDHKLLEKVPSVMLAGVRPEFSAEDVLDGPGLCRALLSPGEAAAAARARIRARVSPEDRDTLARALHASDGASAGSGAACRRAAARALNGILSGRDLFEPSAFEGVVLPEEAERALPRASSAQLLRGGADRPEQEAPGGQPTAPGRSSGRDGTLTDEQTRRLNRHLIDATYPEELRSLVAKEDRAVKGFQMGLSEGVEHISPSEVPWHAWTRTLLVFWVPLILALSAAFVGLALVAHRRWADHEHYPYPIVTFAKSLLPEEGRPASALLKSRMFWVTTCAVAAFHVNNYACLYWPDHLIRIPRRFDFRSLSNLLPALKRGGDWGIMNPAIYFTAIGLAYFVANDVSLSMGIAPFIYAVVAGVFAGYGVAMFQGGLFGVNPASFIKAGAYFGMFLVIVYTGRHHYAAVLRRGLFLRAREDVRAQEKWGARVFLVGALVFTGMLMYVGVRLHWALFYAAVLVMTYVAVGRVVAETGLFLIHPHIFPCVLLWGFVGTKVLGPRQMLVMFVVGSVIAVGTHVNVLPMIDQGLKFVDEPPGRGGPPEAVASGQLAAPAGRGRRGRGPDAIAGRTAALGGSAVLVALLVALPVTLYLQYDRGFEASKDGWTRHTPRFAFNPMAKISNRLEAQGALGEAGNLSGMAWLEGLSPDWPMVLAFAVTLGLVLFTEAMRLRFPRWPFHPIMFLCAGWWHSRMLAVSFLLGWAVKVTVCKYGGESTYRKLRPLMLGLIAGDMLAGILLTIIGTVYYLVTGVSGKGFWVLPG